MKSCSEITFGSEFYKCFSLTCQKPRLRRLAPRRWHPQAKTPSGLSNPCLCLQLWTLPLTPFLLWSSQGPRGLGGEYLRASQACCHSYQLGGAARPRLKKEGWSAPTPGHMDSHRRVRGGSRRGRRSSAQSHPTTQGRDRAGISASLGKPSPKVTLGNVSPNHEKLCILQLGLIYILPLERECILCSGYF